MKIIKKTGKHFIVPTVAHSIDFRSSQLTIRSLFIVHCSLFIVLCSFLSCQTTQKTADEFLKETNFLPLESGASLYIFADAKEARPIIDLLPIEELNESQTKQMLDRTSFFAAALFPKESGQRFQIAAWGNYPVSQADFALSLNKDWQKNRSQAGGSYWYSQTNKLSLAIGSKQSFAASSLTQEPFDPIITTAGVQMPEGFVEFRARSPFSCWLENPVPVISSILSNAGVPVRFPVQNLFINLFPAEDQYHAVIRLQFENTTYARGMAAIFSLAVSSGLAPNELTSIFFANPPVQDGRSVDIKSAVLSEAEIVLLLRLFSIF